MKDADPRMHSAEHILTGALVKLFGMGRPFTTHLEKKKSKADYLFSRLLTEEEAHRVESMVNEQIDRDLPVSEEFLSREQAERVFNLTRLPDDVGETVRIVRIGDFDACPCGGVHVTTTREIGRFRLISWSFEEDALRIRFRLEHDPSGH
jgi:misacylated tRNA(Ala) deacylase